MLFWVSGFVIFCTIVLMVDGLRASATAIACGFMPALSRSYTFRLQVPERGTRHPCSSRGTRIIAMPLQVRCGSKRGLYQSRVVPREFAFVAVSIPALDNNEIVIEYVG
jgi:hypothetical protein